MAKKNRKKLDNLERAKERGEILRIRTIKPNPYTYIHIGVRRKRGKRGGKTVAGRVQRVKKW